MTIRGPPKAQQPLAITTGPSQSHTLGSKAAPGPGFYWKRLQIPGRVWASLPELHRNSSKCLVFDWEADKVMSKGLSYLTDCRDPGARRVCERTVSGITVPGGRGGFLAQGEGGNPPLCTFTFSCRISLVKVFMVFSCSGRSGGMVFCTMENGSLRIRNGRVPSGLLIPVSRPHEEATLKNTVQGGRDREKGDRSVHSSKAIHLRRPCWGGSVA